LPAYIGTARSLLPDSRNERLIPCAVSSFWAPSGTVPSPSSLGHSSRSLRYPYKGLLDTLANRACANGTNAWTDTTNTTYTVTTAGQEGFLNLLPVYIDHVLYPTITDAGFTTEVYHVNGKAEDSGVVYSEMQGRENLSADLMELRSQRAIYSKDSGYRSETGGLMEALRSLSAQQSAPVCLVAYCGADAAIVRDYHAGSYLPHNMTLIVTGRVDPTALLDVLETKVEPRIHEHKQDRGERPKGWTRPWVETRSIEKPTVPSKTERVEFPEKDESSGEWMANWVGPDSQVRQLQGI
jgi:Zn-dependent M16 (insulinase) family peptidase